MEFVVAPVAQQQRAGDRQRPTQIAQLSLDHVVPLGRGAKLQLVAAVDDGRKALRQIGGRRRALQDAQALLFELDAREFKTQAAAPGGGKQGQKFRADRQLGVQLAQHQVTAGAHR